ncbi:MAG: CHAT domain-containing protein [Scytonema sp. PMC 1069.18]|nr:CHAT domain-containing protein [Scytonema sp. PMC 1069.18]MEC4884670.1 CHAT domain-containing protein [Scytonema sp. PMC 1070.18]
MTSCETSVLVRSVINPVSLRYRVSGTVAPVNQAVLRPLCDRASGETPVLQKIPLTLTTSQEPCALCNNKRRGDKTPVMFRTIQPLLKFISASRSHSFHLRRWLTRILLVLGTVLLVLISVPAFPQVPQNLQNPQELIERGRKLYDAGSYMEAVTVLQQAAKVCELQGNSLKQAVALSNLALVSKELGQWETAQAAIAQSLSLINNSGLKTRNALLILGQTQEVQGLLQLELGKSEQALDTWKLAVKTYTQIGDKAGVIRSLINQTYAMQALGLYRQVMTTIEQVNQSLKQQPDSSIKASSLRSLGDTLQLIGDLEQSQKVLQQSRDIAKRIQSPSEVAATLLSLGNTEVALGHRERFSQDYAKVEKSTELRCVNKPIGSVKTKNPAYFYYERAAQYYQEAAISATLITKLQAQLNHLSLLLELQKWSQVQNLLPEIQSGLAQIPTNHSAIFAQINFAQNLACLTKINPINNITSWQEIAQILAKAIQQANSLGDKRLQAYALGVLGGLYLETQSTPVGTLDTTSLNYAKKLTQQALILAQAIQATDITYLWQWQLGNILRIQGNITEATEAYTQAVNTLKSLRKDLVALNPNIQFSFRDNVEPVYRQLINLLLTSPSAPVSGEQKEVSQKNLKQARTVLEELQLTELENFFREACLQPQPKQIDDIVDKTDTTAAVIYPMILKDRLEVILKLPTQNHLRQYTTYISEKEVEETLEGVQRYLREPDRIKDVKRMSKRVFNWLVEPLETELKKADIKTLVFVLDGSLRNIPMAVLYDEKQKQYLVEEYAIAIAPGLQLIDPKPLQTQHLYTLTGGIGVKIKIEGREFPPLENVKLELKTIQSLVPKSKELFNQSFTIKNLHKSLTSATYSIVHIATHGEFSSNADKTFILMWEQLLKVKAFDTLLRSSNQIEEPSPIELLVLSACETATGDKRATLGLAGVAMRAGARSTLATLWSVDDKSTAELMSCFYKELEDTTVAKAEALRRAQVSLLKSHDSPYFWAPYVLVGNWL